MQSPRRNMMSANLTAEESTSLKTNQDLKIPTGHKLTDLHDGNIHITGWPELFLASDEFPDLVVSQAVQDAIAKGDIKMHHADLDILHMYNQPVGCIGDFADIDVSETYPNPYTLFNKPASLFSIGISQHGLSTVKEMKQAREELKNKVNLTEFTNWLENLLGDDLEEYLNLRDRKQSLTGINVLLIMRYKESRRLTTEIMKNVNLDTIDEIDSSEYLGLTINKVLEKIDVLEEILSAKISLFTTKYPGIFDIYDMYNTLVKPRAVPIFGNHQGLHRGEMIIAGGIPPNVPMGSGRHFLDNGQEVFITLEQSDNITPEEIEELTQTTRQKVPPTEYVTVSGPKHEYANQLLKLAETAHVDIPETREERRSRLLTENSVSGAIVKPQNKPLFNKVTHQQMTEDTTTVKKIKNASLSGAYQNLATEQYRDQVTFSEDVQKPIEGVQGSLTGICRAAHQAALETIADSKDSTEEKEMLTAEKAIKILSHSVSTGSNLNVLIIHSILGKLTQEDRDKVSAYFSNNLEFAKPFPETFYPQLISSQRIAEQNNPDHKSVNDFNNRMLMSKQPDIDKCLDQFKKETFLMDSFSAYKPEPMNVKEKLSSLPGYAHSNEQLAEDIKEGNVIMSTIHMTNFIAVTPEGELIPNELDPEDYLKVRQVMREMDEVIEKEFKDKEKFLLENSSLPPGMTLEVEEGETPRDWKTTIHIDGKPLGQFQISRSETVIK